MTARLKRTQPPGPRHTVVMSKHGMGSLYSKRGIWYAQYYVDGRRVQESTKTSDPDEAQRFLKRKLGEAVTGKLIPGTERVRFGEILDDLIAHYREHGLASLPQLESRAKILRDRLGRVRCAEFGTKDISAYVAHRKRPRTVLTPTGKQRQVRGASPATIDRELETIRRAFTLAQQHDPPKVSRIPNVTLYRPDNARQGFVDQSTFRKLRDCMEAHLRLMAIIGYYTGLRAGAIRRIRRDWVNLTAKEIRIPPHRGKPTPDVVPLYGELLGAVEMALAATETNFPACRWLVHVCGRQANPSTTHGYAWKRITNLAGAPGVLFHDLRRSAARNMSEAGIPREVIKKIAGWKTDSIFERYRIVPTKDLHRAAAQLEAWQSNQAPAGKGAVN